MSARFTVNFVVLLLGAGLVGFLFLPELGGAALTAVLFGALIRTRFVPALAWTGLVPLAGALRCSPALPAAPTRALQVARGED